MDTGQIEHKLTRRPYSPLFARLADGYVRDGRTEAAKELLLSGLEKYPSYPAAHLVLARCYATEQNYADALVHLRISVSALPEVEHLLKLEARWEEQVRRTATEPAAEPPPVPAAAAATVDPSPAAGQETPGGLPAAVPVPVIPAPRPYVPLRPVPRTAPSHAGRIEDGRIVSKTLAEIYAMQGEYGEAIITYTMLKHHRPQMSGECDLRISELEQALQAKLNQQKLAVSK